MAATSSTTPFPCWLLRIWKNKEGSVFGVLYDNPGLFKEVAVASNDSWVIYLVTFKQPKSRRELIGLFGAIFAATPDGVSFGRKGAVLTYMRTVMPSVAMIVPP